jgi:hypothetical protein
MEEKRCIECDEIIEGRVDKKFCCDQCRSTYNNRSKQYSNNFIRNTNSILRKNRQILAKLNPDGKVTVHKTRLLNLGFNFNYFTNIYQTKTGKTYHYCYEYGYLAIENDYYALVKKKDYVDNIF